MWEAKITIIPDRRQELISINRPLTNKSHLWDIRKLNSKDTSSIFLDQCFIWLPMGSILTHILHTNFERQEELDTFLNCWLNPPIFDVDHSSDNSSLVLSVDIASTLKSAKKSIKTIIDKFLKKIIINPDDITSFHSAEMDFRLSTIKISLSKEFKGSTGKVNSFETELAALMNLSVTNPEKDSKAKFYELRKERIRYIQNNMFYAYKLTTSDIIAVAFWELAECLRNNIITTNCKVCKSPMVAFKNYTKCLYCELPVAKSRRKRSEIKASSISELENVRIEQNVSAYISRHYGIGEKACIEHIKNYVKKKKYKYTHPEIESLVRTIYKSKKEKIKESEK